MLVVKLYLFYVRIEAAALIATAGYMKLAKQYYYVGITST